MSEKVVLLTGGTGGIGSTIKKMLLQNGYTVITPSRQELDLTDRASIKTYVENLPCTIDILINNAGINPINTVENLLMEDVENTFDINLIAPLLLVKEVVPYMKRKNSGNIINISSIWSKVSKAGRSVYSATKSGLDGITRALAVELGEYNILVNSIAPGFVLTNLTRKNNTDEQIDELMKQIPLKRLADPEEIANLVLFLISNKNTYITGQTIYIDGGFTSQ